jgi:uncharacterized protein
VGKIEDGWSDRSYYLTMRDGVRLAVSLHLPGHAPPAEPARTVLVQTRYGRASAKRSTAARLVDPWLAAGYVVAVVDVRGTAASFGPRTCELGPDECRDMDEIIAHLAEQPWSDGNIIGTGVSYLGNTADMATTRRAPAYVAAIPYSTDVDWWELFWPGGLLNHSMFLEWAEDCLKIFPGLQPVDEDRDCALLQQALVSREDEGRHWRADDYVNALFRDDKSVNGHSFFGSGTAAHLDAVRREKKPVQFWASWLDANTANGALIRYRCAPEVPAVVVITPNEHGGGVAADPFFPRRVTAVPPLPDQYRQRLAFADDVISGRVPERRIHYYVLGAGVFRETTVWPPRGAESARFALDRDGALTRGTPEAGIDSYQVDPTATTGKQNRWYQYAVPAYDDRRAEDRKLLTYDSPPWPDDTELAGWPVVTLTMRTATNDPAVFAYLEDVSPDGRVTYITEGQIRAVHRKLASPATLPYDPGPAPHSFRREDAMPVVPGQWFTLSFKLYPTAALIKKGHRIRLAIAGTDADTFRPWPEGQYERFDIQRGGTEPSVIELPLRPWH